MPLKANVDEAASKTDRTEKTVVFKRCERCGLDRGRDHWWHDLMDVADADCPCESMDMKTRCSCSTSGSTGKLMVMHTTGGYLVYTL